MKPVYNKLFEVEYVIHKKTKTWVSAKTKEEAQKKIEEIIPGVNVLDIYEARRQG